ncbi:tRNA(Met) cytidine acetate ligase [Lachnoclostridium sp. Marseille-P6806]|uniref:tRNA(Met) cytidine acetate ligase n=1 Tax=Lachnoclostridium sp. Marseille-P6806 TaxID=2364793 RepID=UPI0010315560|nr:nucleotidyltransferase family protein [Lachnoclostridium sp. Marseille-P6806]
MTVCGIIMECSPLHRGHVHLLAEARKRTRADYIVVALGGDFMQRGIPAVIDRHVRTRALLESGADLVLELPVYYACAAAGYFARGAVALLSAAGVVTDLAFGSESGDEAALIRIAEILSRETPEFRAAVKKALTGGASWPAARSLALAQVFGIEAPFLPNDLLGVEYLRELDAQGSAIRPCIIPRISAASASALRAAMADNAGTLPTSLQEELPPAMSRELRRAAGRCAPVFPDDFSAALGWLLQSLDGDGRNASGLRLPEYMDVSEPLAARILSLRGEYRGFTDFCSRLKTKDITYTRISRALFHILLGMQTRSMEHYLNGGVIGYLRVLGFRQEAQPLLTAIASRSRVPLIGKLSDAEAALPPLFRSMLNEELRIARLYQAVCAQKFAAYPHPIRSELERPIIVIPESKNEQANPALRHS